jgi:hypothetical protein
MAAAKSTRMIVWSCRAYSWMIWMYPASLTGEYRREMMLTFRNQAEDALRGASVAAAVLFAAHIAADWARTLVVEQDDPTPVSLLGLSSTGGMADGSLDRSTFNGSFLLATLGIALLVGGWYFWLRYTAEIFSHHHGA